MAKCWQSAYKDFIDGDYLSSLPNDYWVDFLETGLSQKSITCLTAQMDGIIVGVSVLGQSITEYYPNDGEVISLYVLPECIGRGIGRRLFVQAQRLLVEQGYTYCVVCVFSNNRAVQFYQSHGFNIVLNDEKIVIGAQELTYAVMRKKLCPEN